MREREKTTTRIKIKFSRVRCSAVQCRPIQYRIQDKSGGTATITAALFPQSGRAKLGDGDRGGRALASPFASRREHLPTSPNFHDDTDLPPHPTPACPRLSFVLAPDVLVSKALFQSISIAHPDPHHVFGTIHHVSASSRCTRCVGHAPICPYPAIDRDC